MRSTLFVPLLLCLLAGISQGFTDFHALNPHHTREEMPDGNIHLRHDVHHTFPEQGTFFRAKYHAVHHKKWHFVDVSKHADFEQHVDCGASANELLVREPSAEFLADLRKQNFEHTVLTAHHMFHCGKEAIFRSVTGVHHDEKHNIAKLTTEQMQYEDLFEHLDFVMETNHLEHEDTEESEPETLQLQPIDSEDAVNPDAVAETTEDGHRMEEQGRWWRRVKKAVKRVVKKVKSSVKKAVTRVKSTWNRVKSFLGGNYSKTLRKAWSVLNYNKDVSKRFTRWGFNGDAKLAVSANAGVTLYFNLQIKSFKINTFQTYVYGSFKAGARAAFNSRIYKDVAASKQFAKLSVAPISFSIVGVSIVITPSMVVNGGYDLDIDGRLNINMVVTASGYIKQGFQYTPSRGFQTINQKYFGYSYDFSPRSYRYEVGLNVYAQANFGLAVNVLGSATAAIQINGEALLQRNSRCSTSMQVNVHPIITLGARLYIRLAGRTILNRAWGPKAYLSTKKTLVSFCTPYRYRRSEHNMLTMEVAGDSDKNSHAITQQQVGSMSMNYTGTTWETEEYYCPTSSGVSSYMQVSAQFMPGDEEDETQLIVNVARNTSTSDGAYLQTNLQQTYAFTGEIVPAMSTVTMHRKTNETEEGSFEADSNENSTAYVANSITLSVGAANSKAITLRESTMLCGSAVLSAATLSDDNSTFTLFASGEGEPETLLTKLKAYAIYAPAVAIVVIAVIVTIVVVTRKKKQEAHQGANWAKAVATDDEPAVDARSAAL